MASLLDRLKAAVVAFWGGSGTVSEAPGSRTKRSSDQVLVQKVGLAADFSREAQGPVDFDFEEITNAYNRESLVRQAIDRYVELIFKAGWDLTSKNQAAVDYVKLRFRWMEEVTGIPTEQLFLEIAEDLVLYSNAIVLKARAKDPSQLPPGVKITGVGGNPPVAGYFPADVTTFTNVRDKHGTVKKWIQEVEGQDKPVTFKPEDVIHFYYKRRRGKAWGTPFLVPVLDDIRALRQAEEHVLRLIYRNLFPFYHYKVGLPKDGYEGTDEEVQLVQQRIENMDLEAGIVTTERHEIKAIAANQIIDAKEYLRYFWERVVMGLGVPETLLGKSNTSNRATADQLSVEMRDRIKAIQKVLATFIDKYMIDELLREGGFDPVLNPEDDVEFTFREIDTDGLIKLQNHAVFLYEHNAITESEMRAMLGRDPITDRSEMHMNLVTIPTALVKANPPSTAETDNKNQPTNQHGTKLSPKRSAQVSADYPDAQILYEHLMDIFEKMTAQVSQLVQDNYGKPEQWDEAGKQLSSILTETGRQMGMLVVEHIEDAECAARTEIALSRLLEQINQAVTGAMTASSRADAMNEFLSACEVLSDRIFLLVDQVYPDAIQLVDTPI